MRRDDDAHRSQEMEKKLHGFPWRFHEQPRASHDKARYQSMIPLSSAHRDPDSRNAPEQGNQKKKKNPKIMGEQECPKYSFQLGSNFDSAWLVEVVGRGHVER